jgi:hypothetical protein
MRNKEKRHRKEIKVKKVSVISFRNYRPGSDADLDDIAKDLKVIAIGLKFPFVVEDPEDGSNELTQEHMKEIVRELHCTGKRKNIVEKFHQKYRCSNQGTSRSRSL